MGEEKIAEELGTDRFTVTATRTAAVAVSALSGKQSGLKVLSWIFGTARAPLVAMDILVQALIKRGRAFVSLYAMLMAIGATILLSSSVAGAQWPEVVTGGAAVVLLIGTFFLLRNHLILFLGLVVLALFLWIGLPFLLNCLG